MYGRFICCTRNRIRISSIFFFFFFNLQRIPYRIVYPNASESEWRLKNKEEKTVSALQLTNPDMEMSEILPDNDIDPLERNKGKFV